MTEREAAVRRALAAVRDPELDEAVTRLGFVSEVSVQGARARVRLRLPTYFCAPNFAFLMAADARRAVLAVDGITEAEVVLEDHFSSAEINGAVRRGGGFVDAFRDEAGGELEELRTLFARKGFLVRQGRLCDALLRAGHTAEELAALRVGDLPDWPEASAYLERRRELGLDASPSAPVVVRPSGEAVRAADVARHLRLARTVRVSVEGNAGLCRGLLRTRYGIADPEEEEVVR
jgi:metal-sulfur cluster biosynthetic enzyme